MSPTPDEAAQAAAAAAGAVTGFPAGGGGSINTTGVPTSPYTGSPLNPLGVPPGYQATPSPGTQAAMSASSADVAAGVFNPDEYGTLDQPGFQARPRYFAGQQSGQGIPGFPTTTAGIIELQNQLIAAGYLDPKQTLVGQWSSTSSLAFGELLGVANQKGVDWHTALANAMSLAAQNQVIQKARPLTVTLTNPDDIRAALKSAARSLYGGDLDEQQTQAFINQFQGQQRTSQTALYNAQVSAGGATVDNPNAYGPGGEVTAAPDLGVEAENAIRQAHPDQVFASALGAHLKALLPGIASPGGGWL